jgi:hypothetical protein
VELNEISGAMVCAFHRIAELLLRAEKEGEGALQEFYPQLGFLMIDEWDFSARTTPRHFPVISDSPALLHTSPALQGGEGERKREGVGDGKGGGKIEGKGEGEGEGVGEGKRGEKREGKGEGEGEGVGEGKGVGVGEGEGKRGEKREGVGEGKGGKASTLATVLERVSVQFGDFLEVYGPQNGDDHAGRFELVVTCFFLDTAQDLVAVLAALRHVLRPGGLWVNAGPLHYHHYRARAGEVSHGHGENRASGRERRSVPYSYSHLRRVIEAVGFELAAGDGEQVRAGHWQR